mmetsp:Transcript_42249/g.122115  ORF Transcript_42249/g.122115 Transcript_42249/m.122115 type:complete len:291 (+) Transcript_42249:865-1737(+)
MLVDELSALTESAPELHGKDGVDGHHKQQDHEGIEDTGHGLGQRHQYLPQRLDPLEQPKHAKCAHIPQHGQRAWKIQVGHGQQADADDEKIEYVPRGLPKALAPICIHVNQQLNEERDVEEHLDVTKHTGVLVLLRIDCGLDDVCEKVPTDEHSNKNLRCCFLVHDPHIQLVPPERLQLQVRRHDGIALDERVAQVGGGARHTVHCGQPRRPGRCRHASTSCGLYCLEARSGSPRPRHFRLTKKPRPNSVGTVLARWRSSRRRRHTGARAFAMPGARRPQPPKRGSGRVA